MNAPERINIKNGLAAALVRAQKGFAPALKTNTNPHFRSKYADLSACVEAVIDSLNNNGIALIQQTHETESGVTVETVFLHESGESMSCGKLHVPASKNDAQGYGSALTYARRYSLMAACGIAPEDDDGNAASRAKQHKDKEDLPQILPAPITPTTGAWEAMDEGQQEALTNIALEVIAILGKDNKGAMEAVAFVKEQGLSPEETVALWTRFDSKQRAAMKKAKEPTPEEYAGQA